VRDRQSLHQLRLSRSDRIGLETARLPLKPRLSGYGHCKKSRSGISAGRGNERRAHGSNRNVDIRGRCGSAIRGLPGLAWHGRPARGSEGPQIWEGCPDYIGQPTIRRCSAGPQAHLPIDGDGRLGNLRYLRRASQAAVNRKVRPGQPRVTARSDISLLRTTVEPFPPWKSFYITTAIDYVNGSPHIGHAYEKVLTDVDRAFPAVDGRPGFLPHRHR